MPTKEKVQTMFNGIAGDYDRLNHIMSLNIDKTWRWRALKEIINTDEPLEILDIACGTGDFAIAMGKKLQNGHISGIDISEEMLAVMKSKVEKAGLQHKISAEIRDGENTEFPENSFDRITIAFGIRNFPHKDKGLQEMFRVLKPGGKLIVLELSVPSNRIVRGIYNIYFKKMMPKIGGHVSGDKKAYQYLTASVLAFPKPEKFMDMMQKAGFSNIRHKPMSLGICRMFIGEKQ